MNIQYSKSESITVEVRGLYGEFDHSATVESDWDFAIVYGPNGIGKTKFFEIADHLSKLRPRLLARLPFESAIISYSEGDSLSVRKITTEDQPHLIFTATLGQESGEWRWSREDGPDSYDRFLSHRWTDLEDGTWMDESDGEILTEDELVVRYGLPRKRLFGHEPPQLFRDFSTKRPIHLIETQRLTGRLRRSHTRSNANSPLEDTVSAYAEDLKRRLGQALGENSQASQSLDQTFPVRLLSEDFEHGAVAEEEIRSKYDAQNQKRSRLAELGLTREGEGVKFPESNLDDWKLRVLNLYLADTARKLSSFDSILEKIDLLKSIVGSRFFRKSLVVNSEIGFAIVPEQRDENLLPRTLSSGEKHELIMFYDLLFRANEGTLVLIDEPEISLHVSWQREFLRDISRVANLSGIRLIIATHSPQIIGPFRDRTINLGSDVERERMD